MLPIIRWTGIAVMLLSTLASVATGQTEPVAPVTPEEKAVRGVLDGFIESLCTADLERFTALLADDATVFFPLPVLPLRLEDKGQIAKAFGAFFESMRAQGNGPRYMNLVPEDVKIQHAGDAAVVTFHLKGGTMISRRTLVLRRNAERWLILHLHASNLQASAR
jgi:hypothetical protein